MNLTIPIIQFIEFDTSEVANPSGNRHIIGGSQAFEQVIGSGCGQFSISLPLSSSGALNFENTKFNLLDSNVTDHAVSKVQCFAIRLASSGIAISNLKFYLTDDTVLTRPALDRGIQPGFIQYTVSGQWSPNPILPSGAGTILSTSIPLSLNINRADGIGGLLAEDDINTSQYVYLNAVIPWGFPFKDYGACGSGILKFALSFDYFYNGHMLNFGVP